MSAADLIRGAGTAGAVAVSGPGPSGDLAGLTLAGAAALVSMGLAVGALGARESESGGMSRPGPAQATAMSGTATASHWTDFVKRKCRSGSVAVGRAFDLGGLGEGA